MSMSSGIFGPFGKGVPKPSSVAAPRPSIAPSCSRDGSDLDETDDPVPIDWEIGDSERQPNGDVNGSKYTRVNTGVNGKTSTDLRRESLRSLRLMRDDSTESNRSDPENQIPEEDDSEQKEMADRRLLPVSDRLNRQRQQRLFSLPDMNTIIEENGNASDKPGKHRTSRHHERLRIHHSKRLKHCNSDVTPSRALDATASLRKQQAQSVELAEKAKPTGKKACENGDEDEKEKVRSSTIPLKKGHIDRHIDN